MTRVGIYGRFSDLLQNPTSVDDQVRTCREYAEQQGWTVVEVYGDRAMTGAFMNRPAIQKLREDAETGKLDIVLAEALDRFSRDQEDIAGLYKRIVFGGAKMFTLTEKEIGPLHIGLKGTMNMLMLSDMKVKVKRGQRGRVEVGKIGGGSCYGYRVVRRVLENNEVENGGRTIDPQEAEIIRRIFREYADGKSARAIASGLNRDNIPGPRGKKGKEEPWRAGKWQQSTIYGNWQRGSGILNNEMYRGRIVWNKVSYPSHPDTGKPVARVNPQKDWVRADVPELRIVDEELWQAVKDRQLRTRTSYKKFWQHKRPVYLFSGLIKCGCCGGGVGKMSADHYGCSTARNKGDAVCANRRNIRQDALEQTVLGALQSKLMSPELLKEFCKEYAAHLNRLRDQHASRRKAAASEIERLKTRATKIVLMAIDGYGSDALKVELKEVEAKSRALQALLEAEPPTSNIRLHPEISETYRSEVTELVAMLKQNANRHEASGFIRALIEKIVLMPDPNSDGLLVNLHGDLAGILNLAIGDASVLRSEEDLRQIRLVSGIDQLDASSRAKFAQRLDAPVTKGDSRRRTRGKLVGPPSHTFAGEGGKLVGPEGLEPPTKRL